MGRISGIMEMVESLPYAPERRPGLWGCFDLMDAKHDSIPTRKRANGIIVTIAEIGTGYHIRLQNDIGPW